MFFLPLEILQYYEKEFFNLRIDRMVYGNPLHLHRLSLQKQPKIDRANFYLDVSHLWYGGNYLPGSQTYQKSAGDLSRRYLFRRHLHL